MAINNSLVSWIATGIYNLESRRFQKANLDRRSEGWTETWGMKRSETLNEEATISDVNSKSKNGRLDEGAISQLLSTPFPQVQVILTQFRPAWFEQMLMRVAGIPHIVINSNHISNEATGQLPYLSDCMPSKPPVLVGRKQPSNIEKRNSMMNNSILEYLQHHRNVNLDEQAGLTTGQQQGLSKCFQYIINLELSVILLCLRFGDDIAWEQVYKEQYVAAANTELCKNYKPEAVNNDTWFKNLYGRFQASSERNIERKRLLWFDYYGSRKSTNELMERANEAYSVIDGQLLRMVKEREETNSEITYLLGTKKPALVDVLLWSHLAEALCDLYLVVLLASYPRLVNYFQNMHDAYFSSIEVKPDMERTWNDWNIEQNFHNAFNKIPVLSKCNSAQYGALKDAVDLMHQSSLQKQSLEEVLNAAKAMRMRINQPKPREPNSYLLYGWCMGHTPENQDNTKSDGQSNWQRKKLLRDQHRNDQMWVSGIFGISVIAILLIRGGP